MKLIDLYEAIGIILKYSKEGFVGGVDYNIIYLSLIKPTDMEDTDVERLNKIGFTWHNAQGWQCFV